MNSFQNNKAVAVEEISFSWKHEKIIDSISVSVQPKQIVSILGPSGCGKSSFLHIVAGLLKPSSGTVHINNINCTGKTGSTSYMQQKDLLFPWKTVLENVSLPLILEGYNREEAEQTASSLFPDFGLDGYQQYLPQELSGGMRQRASLLRTHMMRKKVLLLDEPFGALDSITRKKMQMWLLHMYSTLDCTIILVTHDIEEAIFLSNTIYIFSSLPAKISSTFSISTPFEKRLEFYEFNPEMVSIKKQILSTFF